MPNYWNIYQNELRGRLREDYDKNKAKDSWEKSKKYAIKNKLDILKESKDPYIGIAYKVRKNEKQNLISEKNKKKERVNNSDNEWNKFYHDYKDNNPSAELEEVRKAYNGNIKKLLRISEEDRLKKNKIETETLVEEERHIPDFKKSLKLLITSIILKKDASSSGGFGSEKNTIREGIENIDKTCDDIYNSMVKCYIKSIGKKIMNNTKHVLFDNNYLLENKKIFLYVTKNDLFETMVTGEIIPKSENCIGTLVKNPKKFLVIYKDLLKFKDSSNKESLAIKILRIFIRLGILGYIFNDVPKIDDFFTDGENVYYFNLNNIIRFDVKVNMPSNKEFFINENYFIVFRNANKNIFSKGHDSDKDYYNFEDYDKDKIKIFENIIKETTKHINVPTKTNYTPMYITGAILAALALVGINDVYRSFKKKPNESSNR